jgi:hypothetical protein
MMPMPATPAEVRRPDFNLDSPDRLRRYAWKQLHQVRATIEHIPQDERGSLEDFLLILEKYTR